MKKTFAIISAMLLLTACGKTPTCDDSTVVQTLQNLTLEVVGTGASPELIEEAKINNDSKYKISNISTIAHNKDTDSYTCKASIRFVFDKSESEILSKQEPLDEKSLHSMMLHYGTLFYAKTMNSARIAGTLMLANTIKMNSLVAQDGETAFVEIAQQYTIQKVTNDGKKDFQIDINLQRSQPAVDAAQHFAAYAAAYRKATSNSPLLPKHDFTPNDLEFKSKAQREKENCERRLAEPAAPAASDAPKTEVKC